MCAANDLYVLCGLGKNSVASLLTCDGGACAARPGLVAEKGEPPRTPSIYATDTWSGRLGEAKYKRRDANYNMSGCKVRNGTATANAKCECDAFLYPFPILLLSFSSSVYPSLLDAFCLSLLDERRPSFSARRPPSVSLGSLLVG